MADPLLDGQFASAIGNEKWTDGPLVMCDGQSLIDNVLMGNRQMGKARGAFHYQLPIYRSADYPIADCPISTLQITDRQWPNCRLAMEIVHRAMGLPLPIAPFQIAD
jgi:hypothetical protein